MSGPGFEILEIIKSSLIKMNANTYRIISNERVPSGAIYQHSVEITLMPDGSIGISDDDFEDGNSILLYKEEVELLKEILEKRKQNALER